MVTSDPGYVSWCLEKAQRNLHSEPGFRFFFSFFPSFPPFLFLLSPFFLPFLPPSIILPSLPSFWDHLLLLSFLQTKKFKVPALRVTNRKSSRRGSTLSLSRTSGGSSPQSSMVSMNPGSDEPQSVITQVTGSKDIEDNESSSTKPDEEPLHASKCHPRSEQSAWFLALKPDIKNPSRSTSTPTQLKETQRSPGPAQFPWTLLLSPSEDWKYTLYPGLLWAISPWGAADGHQLLLLKF